MANKLAGQRARFSRARAIYYTSADGDQRKRAVRLMAEVLRDAAPNRFSEEAVTQGEDVPDEVRLALEQVDGPWWRTMPKDTSALCRRAWT